MNSARKPQVVFLSQFFRPETNAASNRMASLLECLARAFDVKLVTLLPSYPSPAHFRHVPLDDGRWGFDILRTKEFSPHEGSFVQRAAREQVMAVGLGRAARIYSPDIVVTTTPSMFLGPVAFALARSKKGLFVWDVRDLTWDYAVDQARGRLSSVAARALRRGLLAVARRADHLFVTNRMQELALREAGISATRITVVPNGVDDDLLDGRIDRPADVPGPLARVTYAGVLGHNQGLVTLIRAAKQLDDLDVEIVLAGDGAERDLLEREVSRLGLSNVRFLGYLDKASLLDVYASSDVLVALLRRDVSRTATPSKLIEYMAMGKPVVYGGEGEGAILLGEAGAGVAVEPEDPDALATALRELLADEPRRAEMGATGRAYVQQHLRRETLAETVAGVLSGLIERRARGVLVSGKGPS